MVKKASDFEDHGEEDASKPLFGWIAEDLVDPEELMRKYPELKDELKSLFKQLRFTHLLGKGSIRDSDRGIEADDIPQVLGDFRIIREIDSGGMATVYEAEQISLKRRVALKVLPSYLSFSERAVNKFQREAEAGGRQTHPGIVLTLALGRQGKIHYIAEEFVEGGQTLDHWLDEIRDQQEPPKGYFRKVADLIAEIADALYHAHTLGVIHRDVKPSNILITPEFKPKVTDFGLARVEGAQVLSATGDFFGTLYYMSPEQVIGARASIDDKTDIYSLGVTLFECLTLERPFEADTRELTLQQILIGEPKDPATINKRVPRDLATICLKAIDRNPARRYDSMEEFAEDLRRYLGGEAIAARPTGSLHRLWRRIKRNPVLSAISALAVLSVTVLVVYVLWSYPMILSERNKALEARAQAEQEAHKAKAMNEFLQKMFLAPSPGIEGRDVKVIDMLDRAAEEAETALGEEPVIEADLRTTLGRTYYNLGIYDKARGQFEHAIEHLNDELGEEEPETISVLRRLASTYWAMGDLDKAEAMHRKVLEFRERVLGSEHPDTLQSKHSLASTLSYQGDLEGAAGLLREVIEARRRVLGEEHRRTLHSINNLAILLLDLGRYPEAEVLFREAKSVHERNLGEDHPETIGSCVNLVCALAEQHKFDEAEPLARECLEKCRKVMGEDHPKTFVAECTLAQLFMAAKRYPEAEATYLDLLERQRRVLGETHPDTLPPAINLGFILNTQKKIAEAEEHFKKTVPLVEGELPEGHPLKAMFHMYYADFLVLTERFEEAEALYLKGIAVFEVIYGPEDEDTREGIEMLIKLYDKWNKPEKAARYRDRLSPPKEGEAPVEDSQF
ncbi:MAG: serine/threonine-protein kinase [Planctomycetota bacterium]|jgi:serine/threonine protein kinase